MVAIADKSNQPIFHGIPNEWPYPLLYLVTESRRIMSYFEIPEEGRPPKSLWHSPDKCEKWITNYYKKDDKGSTGGDLTFNDYERQ